MACRQGLLDRGHRRSPLRKRIGEEIAPDEMTEKKHPHVAAWRTRLQARPAYAEANFGPFVDF
jgi:glutathione S-transferase